MFWWRASQCLLVIGDVGGCDAADGLGARERQRVFRVRAEESIKDGGMFLENDGF